MKPTFKMLALAGAVASLMAVEAQASPTPPSLTIFTAPSTPTLSPFTIPGEFTFTYSTATAGQLADRIAFGAGNYFSPQDPASIGSQVYTALNLTGPLYLSSYTDGTVGTGATQTGNATNTGSFTSTVAYQYLAVHFGQDELVFDFSKTGGIAANTAFNIGGLPFGLSNWRGYTTANTGTPPVAGSPVPLPAGAWLFMTGLMGLLYNGKKKSLVAGLVS
jgi:hypothetical protein